MSETAADAAAQLLETVAAVVPILRSYREPAVSRPRAPGKWSPKQILGHLIDSAANNHQRFVRAQIDTALAHPGYEQDAWVAVQAYQESDWQGLIDLWVAYNRHLVHIISRIPPETLGRKLSVGGGEPVDLLFLARDYVSHLQHHLGQLGVEGGEIGKSRAAFLR